MSELEDPPRLLDGSDAADAELRAALGGARAVVPSEAQMAAMAARLGIPPEPGPPPADGGGSGASGLSAKGLALGAGGLAAIVVAALALGGGPDEPRGVAPEARVAVSAASPVVEAPRAPELGRRSPSGAAPETSRAAASQAVPEGDESHEAPSPGAPLPEPPEDESAPSESPRSPARLPAATGSSAAKAAPAPKARPAPSPHAPVAASETEVELLGRARSALSADPAQTLALTELHRHKYPSGGYTQERELLAITALVRLGRTAEARARADRFRAAYPSSPYSKRIDRLTP